MDSLVTKVLAELVNYGPGALVGIIFGVFFVLERKKSQSLADKLYDLGKESIKTDIEHMKSFSSLEKVFDRVLSIAVERDHHDQR